jgi:methylamine---glutamate N-methyltransferase subunit C
MVLEHADIRLKIPDTKENRKKCMCRSCPSYPHNNRGEIIFCGTQASGCDIEAQGCICNACTIYFDYGLKSLYYCNQVEIGKKQLLMRKKKSNENDHFYRTLVDIREQSLNQESVSVSMGSQKKLPFSLDDIFFIPAQINKIPLNQEEYVNCQFILGPHAKKPLKLFSPIMISGMSFGAVSKNVKLVIKEVARELKIAFNSGEGGLIPEERDEGWQYRIVQYSTGRYGVSQEILKQAAAVEIRFGQGAYPGKGSYLPAEKMTPEVASIRGLEPGEGSYSPAHHKDIKTEQDVKNKVSWLRNITDGVPIGAKIGCGDVKKDVELLANSGVDFITLDGFGGGTGATDLYVRENVGIPLLAALPQANQILEEMGLQDQISLIASGGLRTSADMVKCLALGADAVYIGTAALIAINCQQYRICNTGLCPTGVTTQNPQLVTQINIDEGLERLKNFIKISNEEMANLVRIIGKSDINKLDKEDLISINKDISQITGIRWVNGKYIE